MKKLLAVIVSVVLTCFHLNVKAQVDESRNFIYFTSDSILYAENVRLRADFFNSMKLRVNSQHIPLQEVKFVNSDAGFFATTRKSDVFRKARFAERVIAGRLNLYEQSSNSSGSYFGPSSFGASGFAGPVGFGYMPGGTSKTMFYNKGYQDLKKVNYANLKVDMTDNTESIDLLENYKRSKNTSKMMFIGAAASLVATAVTFFVASHNNGSLHAGANNGVSSPDNPNTANFGDYKATVGLLGLGVGLGLGSYFTNKSSFRKLEAAIDTYNR